LTRSHSFSTRIEPACDSHRAQALPRNDKGVDLKRRPPKSRPAASPSKACALDRERGAQGLRRPRFSFFRFTCQTAWDQAVPPSGANRRAVEARGLRLSSGAYSPNISEELRRRAVAPRRRRAEFAVYRDPNCQMSTPRQRQNRPSQCNRATAIFLNDIGGLAGVPHAVLRPHSSAPLVGAMGGVTSGGIGRRPVIRDERRTHRLGQKS
jgi:hypothetical protein